MNAANEYLTIRQLARVIPACEETLRRWIRRGRLPATLVGNRYLVRWEDLRVFLRRASPDFPQASDRFVFRVRAAAARQALKERHGFPTERS